MMNRDLALRPRLLIWIGLLFSASTLFAGTSDRELRLWQTFNGDFSLTSGKKNVPQPFLIKSTQDLDRFKSSLPKFEYSESDGEDPSRPYSDALTYGAEVNLKGSMMLIWVLDGKHGFDYELSKAVERNGVLVVTLVKIPRELSARPAERGFYIAWQMDRSSLPVRIEEVAPTEPRPYFYEDEANDVVGIQLGKEKIPTPQYRMPSNFDVWDHAFVGGPDGWYMVDKRGRPILKSLTFDNGPDYFQEGLARYEEKGKIGYYDRTGKIVIPAQFEWADSFKDGAAQVSRRVKFVKDDEHTQVIPGEINTIDASGKLLGPWKKP